MSASDPKRHRACGTRVSEVDSPPKEDVLSDVPSKEEIIESAQSAQDVLAEQPSVDELLGRDRSERAPARAGSSVDHARHGLLAVSVVQHGVVVRLRIALER